MRRLADRKGQTAVEYLLTTVSVLVIFTVMYHFMGTLLKQEFFAGATLILRMYVVQQ